MKNLSGALKTATKARMCEGTKEHQEVKNPSPILIPQSIQREIFDSVLIIVQLRCMPD